VLPYLSALENAVGIQRHFTNVEVYFTFTVSTIINTTDCVKG